jgi:alkylation response protein AidB-like acyl-CoA dehydrogenase
VGCKDDNLTWTYARASFGDPQIAMTKPATCAESYKGQLADVGQAAAQTPWDGRSVADDEAFQRQYCELGVDVVGLEALELRVLAEQRAAPKSACETSVLNAVVALKGKEIGHRIAQLGVETLGYYALPLPDELLIDNEGPIGPAYARGAMRRWLRDEILLTDAGSTDRQKDIIAQMALGIEVSG